jgi:hypothetical protein
MTKVKSMLKLFGFQPPGHGQYSFFVMAETKEAAVSYINKYIEDHLNKDDGHFLSDYYIQGWPEDYDITEAAEGNVITHAND